MSMAESNYWMKNPRCIAILFFLTAAFSTAAPRRQRHRPSEPRVPDDGNRIQVHKMGGKNQVFSNLLQIATASYI